MVIIWNFIIVIKIGAVFANFRPNATRIVAFTGQTNWETMKTIVYRRLPITQSMSSSLVTRTHNFFPTKNQLNTVKEVYISKTYTGEAKYFNFTYLKKNYLFKIWDVSTEEQWDKICNARKYEVIDWVMNLAIYFNFTRTPILWTNTSKCLNSNSALL